jgi:hypothetical protein
MSNIQATLDLSKIILPLILKMVSQTKGRLHVSLPTNRDMLSWLREYHFGEPVSGRTNKGHLMLQGDKIALSASGDIVDVIEDLRRIREAHTLLSGCSKVRVVSSLKDSLDSTIYLHAENLSEEMAEAFVSLILGAS